jgi:hypothetical protein
MPAVLMLLSSWLLLAVLLDRDIQIADPDCLLSRFRANNKIRVLLGEVVQVLASRINVLSMRIGWFSPMPTGSANLQDNNIGIHTWVITGKSNMTATNSI